MYLFYVNIRINVVFSNTVLMFRIEQADCVHYANRKKSFNSVVVNIIVATKTIKVHRKVESKGIKQ